MSDTGPDQTITCKDCRTDFVFTDGERKFYEDKGYQIPKRCKACRDARKAQNNQQERGPAPSADRPADEYRPQKNNRKGGRRDDRDDRY
jgi:hypothetical protein